MNSAAYLERIDYRGPTTPSWETLCDLQTAHLLAVPFENLDIHLGRRIALDLPRIFQKVVVNRRGGFCYELNGLFSWLLIELGFDLSLISAQVYSEDKARFGIPYDHLALAVTLDGTAWLADVGFGHFFAQPLRIKTEAGQQAGGVAYKIVPEAAYFVLSMQEGGGAWRVRYRFDLAPRTFAEFAPGCHYHQTSPDTTFTQGRLCSQPQPNGRITLTDDQLIVTQAGKRMETAVADDDHFLSLLKTHFDIDLRQNSTIKGV